MRKFLLYHVLLNIFFILKYRYEKNRGCFFVFVGASSTEATLKSVFLVCPCMFGTYNQSYALQVYDCDTVLTSALGPGQ